MITDYTIYIRDLIETINQSNKDNERFEIDHYSCCVGMHIKNDLSFFMTPGWPDDYMIEKDMINVAVTDKNGDILLCVDVPFTYTEDLQETADKWSQVIKEQIELFEARK